MENKYASPRSEQSHQSGKRKRALWYRLPAGECGIGFQSVQTV